MDKVLNTNGFPNIQIPPAPPTSKTKGPRPEMVEGLWFLHIKVFPFC